MTNQEQPKRVVDPNRQVTSTVSGGKSVLPLFKAKEIKLPTPVVIFTQKAWAQMYTIIPMAKAQDTEVTWFTPIEVTRDQATGQITIRVPEIFLPRQEVQRSYCDHVDVAPCLDEAFEAGYDIDAVKGWMHLHPGASVEPSRDDQEATEDHLQGWSTMLRGIFNAEGKYRLDFYDEETNSIYQNLNITFEYPEEFDLAKFTDQFEERVTKKSPPPPATTNTMGAGTAGVHKAQSTAGNSTTKKVTGTNVHSNKRGHNRVASGTKKKDNVIEFTSQDNKPIYLGNIFQTAAYIYRLDLMVDGEDAQIFMKGDVEFGMTLYEAVEGEEVELIKAIQFIRNNFNGGDHAIDIYFPGILKMVRLLGSAEKAKIMQNLGIAEV